jgi:mono/diheme cytochrome c family protein
MRVVIALATFAAPLALLAAPAPPPKKASSQFPAGPGVAQVSAACSACHARDIVLNARKNRLQWEQAVDRMIDRGAKVSDADYDRVVDYLVKNFGATR